MKPVFFIHKQTMIFFILIFLICFTIGIILILLSGFFHVKEKKVAVFEKMYKFLCIKEKGNYFFIPFFVRRVGYYDKDIQYIRINLDKCDVFIKYKITDFYKYHYAGHCFKEIMGDELNKHSEEITPFIKNKADQFGITILDIHIKIKTIQQ